MGWRRVAVVVMSAVLAACASQDPGVQSLRAEDTPDQTVDPTTSTTEVAPTSPRFPDEPLFPDAPLYSAAPTAVFADAPVLMVPHVQQEPEKALHALASTSDGWLAVGSITYPGQHGAAAVWSVAMDATFGAATLLPATSTPGVARGALSDDFGTIVVGSRGTGRESVPTAWLLGPGSVWSIVDLPLDLAHTHGAIADRVLRLADGTTVAVGRGNGPFFADLVLWSSTDGGTSWTLMISGMKSFLEPLVATDGARVAVFARTYPDPITGFAGHTTVLYGIEGDTLAQLDISLVDLAPGRRYWPKALVWDGTQFVVGIELDLGPAVATSTDGVTYTLTEFRPPELDASVGAGVLSLAMVDGALVVAVQQQSTLYMYRREGSSFTAIDVPHTPSGSLAYLDYRRLSASDGHRFAYVAADWDRLTMLSWDGESWTSGVVPGLPLYRNSARLEVNTLVNAAGADLALLREGSTEAPGRFVGQPAGLLWRPTGSSTWLQFDMALTDGSTPVAIAEWRDAFVVVGHDYTVNRSTLFRVNPATGVATPMATLEGVAGAIVTDSGHLYARVSDTADSSVGNSTLWQSSDGTSWSEVDLDFAPRALCTDGTTAVVEWMTSDGGSSTMGTATIDGESVVPHGSPFEFQLYQVEPEQDQVVRCGVNSTGVVTTLQGYDRAIAEISPQARVLSWIEGPTNRADLVLPVSPEGAWKSDIKGITWNGHEWIAVGAGGDVESAWDALLWRSQDGLVWEPASTLAGGPGNQTANSVMIRDGEMLIGGFDGQNAVIWRLPE